MRLVGEIWEEVAQARVVESTTAGDFEQGVGVVAEEENKPEEKPVVVGTL